MVFGCMSWRKVKSKRVKKPFKTYSVLILSRLLVRYVMSLLSLPSHRFALALATNGLFGALTALLTCACFALNSGGVG